MEEEVWKRINIEDVTHYEVSNMGEMRSLVWGKYLRQCVFVEREGYLRVNISKGQFKKRKTVHRLVAEAFIPNPEGLPEVNHINGDKKDNRVSNLEWCTKSQNAIHAYKTGLTKLSGGYKIPESKPLGCFKNGVLIKKYRAIYRAKVEDGFFTTGIYRAIKNGTEYKGYTWKLI